MSFCHQIQFALLAMIHMTRCYFYSRRTGMIDNYAHSIKFGCGWTFQRGFKVNVAKYKLARSFFTFWK